MNENALPVTRMYCWVVLVAPHTGCRCDGRAVGQVASRLRITQQSACRSAVLFVYIVSAEACATVCRLCRHFIQVDRFY